MAAAITAAEVKALREATGMGMMECKKALQECEGDFNKARDWLRVKSGAKADKVAARQASEGRVAYAEHNGTGVLAEISCETDFVARDNNIGDFAQAVAQAVAQAGEIPADIGALMLAEGQSVEDTRRALVMKIGENISVRRVRTLAAGSGQLCVYVHRGDKAAAMCVLHGDADIGRDICMHAVAMQPQYLNAESVPEEVIAREREVFIAQAAEAGKPAEMAEKIAAGKLGKRLGELTLLPQPFVKDTEVTIAQLLEKHGASLSGYALLVAGAAE